MTSAGWAIMCGSLGFVLSLAGFCFWRMLTLPAEVVQSHLKAPLEIDTRDTHDAD
ncbi:MAG: hypothetical protein KF688_18795 [Pirellulales bacterium]|nr:hypothetical protein [Pirellulales bacterium]MBX3434056.1 hypothetical protein [Pirellulales bacterium]